MTTRKTTKVTIRVTTRVKASLMTRWTTKVQMGLAMWVDEGDNEDVNEVTMG